MSGRAALTGGKYPRDEAAREALRLNFIELATLHAITDGSWSGHSMRCREGDHWRFVRKWGWQGCANDGSTCLCRCHDRRADQ